MLFHPPVGASPGKNKHISSSDTFPLKPTGNPRWKPQVPQKGEAQVKLQGSVPNLSVGSRQLAVGILLGCPFSDPPAKNQNLLVG